MAHIQSNVLDVKKRISESAERGGRTSSDITLVGVTKTVDVDRIMDLINCGVKNLGENKVQEFVPKFEKIQNQADWHFIAFANK